MTELASTISKLTLVIKVKTGEDGKMFGSVTSGTIADELKPPVRRALDKRKIHLAASDQNARRTRSGAAFAPRRELHA